MNISILRFLHGPVAHSSYLLVDPQTGTAAVIDPYHVVEPYLEAAQWMCARIRHIFLTQQHDDFQGGQLHLRKRTGATIYAGAWMRPRFEFLPVKDGDVLEFGQLRLKILETPGHRLEGITVVAYDLLSSDSQAHAAFTGDTLLVGDVGLPEPRVEDGHAPADLARMLYDSIRHKLLTLSPSTRIYPAHAHLDPCDRDALFGSENLLSNQGERNPALRPMSLREFEIRILAGMKRDLFPAPVGNGVRLRPVSVSELLQSSRAGANVVDLRSPADFAAAHLEKSINVPLAAAFETWVEAVLDRDEAVILVAPPGREQEAAARLEAVGFARVGGYLKGGIQALEDRPLLLGCDRRYSMTSLEDAMLEPRPPQLVEIGRSGDRGAGRGIPLEHLRTQIDQLSPGRELAICSETPFRSSAAASFLRSRGFPQVRTLAGGLALWGRRPLESRALTRKR
jgi:glyoxylase-like metal-dependent hydrolase (beta-lactamase superfamily II)/rhodanese-related sulfurtransferase